MDLDSKICRTCEKRFPLTEFYKSKNSYAADHKSCANKKTVAKALEKRQREPEKWQAYWKERNSKRSSRTMKSYNIKSQFGITIDDYETLLEKQKGLCAICGKSNNGARKYFTIDHDHETKKVRGLLCNQCNTGIGMLGDSAEIVIKAAAYLLQHSS